MKKRALGVDIGNVIIDHRVVDPDDKKLHEERYSTIPPVDDAFESLKKLNRYFDGEVYLISKCTPWAQEKIIKWLQDRDFHNLTGIAPKNVMFVRERHEKDSICRKLDVTHFIDDRLEVLSHMIESTPNLFLFRPDESEVNEFKEFLPKAKRIDSWDQVIKSIISD